MRALALVLVGRLDAQLQGELGPGLDLAVLELTDEPVEREDAEALAVTARRRLEGLAQGGRVCGRHDGRVAGEDEGDVGILNGGCREGAVWQHDPGSGGSGRWRLLHGHDADVVHRHRQTAGTGTGYGCRGRRGCRLSRVEAAGWMLHGGSLRMWEKHRVRLTGGTGRAGRKGARLRWLARQGEKHMGPRGGSEMEGKKRQKGERVQRATVKGEKEKN